MVLQNFDKDPSAVLDYSFDWTEWLETLETISSYVITVDTGLTKDSDSQLDGVVTIWLSGGTADVDYLVACKITTSLTRVDERTVNIRCRNR